MTSADLEALVLLSRTPGIGMVRIRKLLERKETDTSSACPLFLGESPSEILERIRLGENQAWKESLGATGKIFNPAKEIAHAEELGIEIIPFGDPRYPALLKETSDPPLLLYCKGALIESDQAACAIVGSRHPSLYGREQAKRFGQRLSEWGLTIVSGFARGIDREAHEAALSVRYGRTLAVLGSGLDVAYPKEHKVLYEEIAERGALLSEFALGTQPFADNFPKRNRIIAGLSLGVLVVEAHSRSGSLITARLATEEGREVFALPGRVDQLGSRGTHSLIKEGAALVESPEEIFDTLGSRLWPLVSQSASNQPLDEKGDEKEKEFLALFDAASLTVDQTAARSNLPVSLVLALLTKLELKGVIRKRHDGRYERLLGIGERV